MRDNALYDKSGSLLFFAAMLMGLAVAAPVGPVSLLCFRKTIESGLWAGISVGIGSALADVLYALLAFIGFHLFSDFLAEYHTVLKIGSVLLFIVLGIREFFQGKPRETLIQTHVSWKLMAQSFFLTLANPVAILVFMGIFSMHAFFIDNTQHPFFLLLGVFSGATLWWSLLAHISTRLSASRITWFHACSCVFLFICTLWMILCG